MKLLVVFLSATSHALGQDLQIKVAFYMAQAYISLLQHQKSLWDHDEDKNRQGKEIWLHK